LATFPVWVYRHGGSRDPRPQHLAWDGLTLPADHPFWQTHSPPNGWGCSCYVVGARSEEAARRLGGEPGKALPDGWDARDGRGRLRGIDEGWDYAPGASVVCRGARNATGGDDRRCVDFSLVETVAQKAAALVHQLGAALLASVVGKDFPVWWAQPTRAFPLARLPDADAEALGARPGVRVAYISAETAAKQRRAHPELTPDEYSQAQRVIDQARVRVIETQITGTRDLIYVLDDPRDGFVLVVKATRAGDELWIKTLYRLSRVEALRDREIRRLLRKGERK
jgi:hypothetical protein